MKDFSQLLVDKKNAIVQQWVDKVIQDKKIKSADHLSRGAIKDHVTEVLTAMQPCWLNLKRVT